MLKTIRTWLAIPFLVCGSAYAQVRDPTPEEEKKVRQILDLLEESFEKSGVLDCELTDTFNPDGSPGGAANQIPYEGNAATMKDALDKLRDMLDSGRIQVDTKREKGARTKNQPGTDADTIKIAGGVLKAMCNPGNNAERFFQKIKLCASLANEAVHIWQFFSGDDARQCDAERDSDTSTILFMCDIHDAFDGTMGPGEIDADLCPILAACVASYNLTAGADWNRLRNRIRLFKEYYEERRLEKFDVPLNGSTSWGKNYYTSSGYAGPIIFAELVSPTEVKITIDGVERTYTLPAGKKVLQRSVRYNDAGMAVLTIVAQDVSTKKLCVYVYTDTDGDMLPEPTPVVSEASTPANNTTDNEDLFELPFAPGDDEDGQAGWSYLDASDGTLYVMPVDPGTLLPTAPFFDVVYTEPLLSEGGGDFFYHLSVLPNGANRELWLFTSTPPVMAHGDQPALLIEVDTLTGIWSTIGTSTIAQAYFPSDVAGTTQLDAGQASIQLTGYPSPSGGTSTLFSIGNGPSSVLLGPAAIDSAGLSGSLPIAPLTGGLFLIETHTPNFIDQHQVTLFQPPLGENIACILVDESGDGTNDRLHLTVDPPRLHIFQGIPADPNGSMNHIGELVLETDEARDFSTWSSATGRVLAGMRGDIVFPLTIPTSGMPIYVQSLHDLDGDLQSDDAVRVIGTDTLLPSASYRVEVILDALTTPQFTSINLNFVPVDPLIADLNGDGSPDLHLSDFNGGSDRCFLNNGSGLLLPGNCVIGGSYCGPAVPNSSGNSASINATGSIVALDNDLVLTGSNMPNGQFAYFLASLTQGFIVNPGGSQGVLCLAGNIARFSYQVGPIIGGQFSIQVDTQSVPQNPVGPIFAGESWNFTCWFRDVNPVPTSNFTDGYTILFH